MEMNAFQNKLILGEVSYEGGLFPKIPKFQKEGSAFILAGGCGDDICITERTTSREIRRGKYTRLVEVSTRPYVKEIRFRSNAKEQAYSFDVYVKAVIRVENPITFYHNRDLDVDGYFHNLLSIDVKQITRQYSLLDYGGLDLVLTQKLSAYNNLDTATGFSYQVSQVDAEPGGEAKEFVARSSKQQLETALSSQAGALARRLTTDYAEAVMMEVTEGKLSLQEAILRIEQHQDSRFDKAVDEAAKLIERGLLTEKQAKVYIQSGTKGPGRQLMSGSGTTEAGQSQDGFDELYPGE